MTSAASSSPSSSSAKNTKSREQQLREMYRAFDSVSEETRLEYKEGFFLFSQAEKSVPMRKYFATLFRSFGINIKPEREKELAALLGKVDPTSSAPPSETEEEKEDEDEINLYLDEFCAVFAHERQVGGGDPLADIFEALEKFGDEQGRGYIKAEDVRDVFREFLENETEVDDFMQELFTPSLQKKVDESADGQIELELVLRAFDSLL